MNSMSALNAHSGNLGSQASVAAQYLIDAHTTRQIIKQEHGDIVAFEIGPTPDVITELAVPVDGDKEDKDATVTRKRRAPTTVRNVGDHVCGVCHKRFRQLGHLTNHLRLHTGERPFGCDICGKKFSQSGHLVSHIRSHTNTRPYECQFCKKRFTQSGHLNNHERLHLGHRPYTCSHCGKSFTQSGHLVNHIRLHDGEKPFQCSVCQKKFTQSGHLNNHMKLHNGGKPHECHFCHKRFVQAGHLTDHIRTHTNEKPFECSVCAKAFSQNGHLNAHMKTHRNMNLEATSPNDSKMQKPPPPPPVIHERPPILPPVSVPQPSPANQVAPFQQQLVFPQPQATANSVRPLIIKVAREQANGMPHHMSGLPSAPPHLHPHPILSNANNMLHHVGPPPVNILGNHLNTSSAALAAMTNHMNLPTSLANLNAAQNRSMQSLSQVRDVNEETMEEVDIEGDSQPVVLQCQPPNEIPTLTSLNNKVEKVVVDESSNNNNKLNTGIVFGNEIERVATMCDRSAAKDNTVAVAENTEGEAETASGVDMETMSYVSSVMTEGQVMSSFNNYQT